MAQDFGINPRCSETKMEPVSRNRSTEALWDISPMYL